WQHQLPALAGAGFRAVAVDLRGYGASDKPPRGYDGFTAAADILGLIRALGEKSASIVGAGYGGQGGWATRPPHPPPAPPRRAVRRRRPPPCRAARHPAPGSAGAVLGHAPDAGLPPPSLRPPPHPRRRRPRGRVSASLGRPRVGAHHGLRRVRARLPERHAD